MAQGDGFDDIDGETTTVQTVSPETLRDVFPEGVAPQPVQLAFVRGTHHGPLPEDDRQVALEVFTRNRIYIVGFDWRCIEVVDRQSRRVNADHRALGAYLTGGQRRYGKTVHFSRPFPVPGTEAVFETPGRRRPAAVTSKVESVSLYVRIDTIVLQEEGAWEEVTSALLRPGALPFDS
ncbi:MAG: hypothetical protein ACOCV4_02620 [Myxococcota bacterium]